jgi:hypothetical protein
MRFQLFAQRPPPFYSTYMTNTIEIEAVFDAALDQVQRIAATGLVTPEGHSVVERLGQLEFRLRAERAKAVEQGRISAEWVRQTIRWVVEWMPESDLTVIAALGRIARLAPRDGLS